MKEASETQITPHPKSVASITRRGFLSLALLYLCLVPIVSSRAFSGTSGREKPVAYVETPRHEWLGGRRVRFSVPTGWSVAPLPPDEVQFPKGWWRENWDKTGIAWRFTKAGHSVDFQVAMAYRSHSDTARPWNAVDVYPKNQAFEGFTYVCEYIPDWQTRWVILRVPKYVDKDLFLVCSAEYAKNPRYSSWPAIHTIVRGVSVLR